MEFANSNIQPSPEEGVHFGHLGAVMLVAVFLLGVSWIKNPALFSFLSKSQPKYAAVEIPQYYAYTPPPEDSQALVAGANTQPTGPSIINEDGTITSAVSSGDVLGASTQDVSLPLDQIAVKQIPDSSEAIKKYFAEAQNIESGYINNTDFEAALSSGNQKLIDQQAQKITDIKNNLQLLAVPASLAQLQKLKIAQYNAAVGVLKNFTQADSNPELVGQYLDQFLKSQQDLDTENTSIQQKFGIDLGYPSQAVSAEQANSNGQ